MSRKFVLSTVDPVLPGALLATGRDVSIDTGLLFSPQAAKTPSKVRKYIEVLTCLIGDFT